MKRSEDPTSWSDLVSLCGREYLLAANRDARAFVVHMAGLVHGLRNMYRLPLHRRHVLALESLQVPPPT